MLHSTDLSPAFSRYLMTQFAADTGFIQVISTDVFDLILARTFVGAVKIRKSLYSLNTFCFTKAVETCLSHQKSGIKYTSSFSDIYFYSPYFLLMKGA